MHGHLHLRRMSAILVLLQLLGCISMGVAIECYVCDSTLDPGCTHLWSDSSISPVNCTLEQIKSMDTWLMALNKFSYFDNGANKNPVMNCQKVVARDPNTQVLVTARFCQLDTADSNACNILRTKMNIKSDSDEMQGGRQKRSGQQMGRETAVSSEDEFFCGICNEDRCNGADAVTLSSAVTIGLMLLLLQLMTRPLRLSCCC